jgi:DNA repair exonuclease SbcCD ATPase subunit
MRVQKLVLKNFRSHQETVLELDRLNFIRGPNGCGKSSIQMALEYLFTGRCALTDAAGRGAEVLIRSGEKELEVSATLASGETICRRRTQGSQIVEINGKRLPVDVAETFLTKKFGSADVLSAVLNGDRFVEMAEAEQQRFLAQLVGAGQIDIPKEIGDALSAINEEPPRPANLRDVETAYKRFYDLRTGASRALKALGQMEKPDVPSDLPTVREVRKKLEELREQKERLIAQKAEADACWQNAKARLTQLQTEIAETAADILSPSEEQELFQQKSLRAQVETLRQELTELTADQRIVEKALATAQGLKDKCPTCGQAISAAAKAKEIQTLGERLTEIEGLMQGTREELHEHGDPEAATLRLEAHRRAQARRVKLVEEQSEVEAVKKPDAADLESRMTMFVERINKTDRVLERAQQVQAAREKWEAHVAEKSKLETRLGLLDRLVEFFGTNGAVMTQASCQMGSFGERLRVHLAVFGYACKFSLDPFEIRVILALETHAGFSLQQLSESERFRFSIALQLALAAVTGIRFLVIDRADVLDKEKRKLLTALLSSSTIDQAIVFATAEEGTPPQVPEGVKFLSLTGQKPSKQLLPSAVA